PQGTLDFKPYPCPGRLLLHPGPPWTFPIPSLTRLRTQERCRAGTRGDRSPVGAHAVPLDSNLFLVQMPWTCLWFSPQPHEYESSSRKSSALPWGCVYPRTFHTMALPRTRPRGGEHGRAHPRAVPNQPSALSTTPAHSSTSRRAASDSGPSAQRCVTASFMSGRTRAHLPSDSIARTPSVVSSVRSPAASTTARMTLPFTAHGVGAERRRRWAWGIRRSIWLTEVRLRATRPSRRTNMAMPSL